MRQARPHEHGAVGVGALPADLLQAVAQDVATLLVLHALLLDLLARASERGDGRVLLGVEHAEVDLAAQLVGRGHDVGPAHEEGQPAASHVERLGEREELHAHLARARVGEEAAAGRPVIDDVGVGVVVDDDHVMLARELDDLLVHLGRAHRAHRVGRQRDHHVLGAVGHLRVDSRHVWQEVMLGRERVVGARAARERDRVAEDGVARVGHEDGVARVDERGGQRQHALLRAAAAHDHVALDALYAKAVAVVAADGVEQLVLVVERVLPVGRVLGALCQGIDDVLGRPEVGRSHGEVVDGAAGRLELAATHVKGSKDLVSQQVQTLRQLHGALQSAMRRAGPPRSRNLSTLVLAADDNAHKGPSAATGRPSGGGPRASRHARGRQLGLTRHLHQTFYPPPNLLEKDLKWRILPTCGNVRQPRPGKYVKPLGNNILIERPLPSTTGCAIVDADTTNGSIRGAPGDASFFARRT